MTPELIGSLKEVALALIGGYFAYIQSKCRKDLDVAHGRIRELMGEPNQFRKRSPLGRMFYRGKK
jgi:hypothetical protein